MVAIQVWMEMMDLTLVLQYLSGDPLKEELQERRAFMQESLIPVMDMFLLEVRDKQVMRPVLYVDYMITAPTSGTVKGDGSEASVDGAFRTPAGEEMEQIEGRVEAMTLGPINVPPQNVIGPQPEPAAAQVTWRPKTDRIKSENVQKILSLSGLSAERKLQMISQLTNQEKKPGDQLDSLAERFNLKTKRSIHSSLRG